MSTPSGIIVMGDSEWLAENARRLDDSTQRLIEVLASHLAGNAATFEGERDVPPALEQLAIRFGLTPFERDLLLLCVACERSSELAGLIGRWRGSPQECHVDFDLARLVLGAPDRLALSPSSALRRWRLLDLHNTRGWSQARLIPDERVQFFLAGYSFLDSRLEGLVRPMRSSAVTEETLAARISQALRAAAVPALCPIVQLSGLDTSARHAVFVTTCEQLQLRAYMLAATDIPAQAAEREALARIWEREAVLLNGALLICAEDLSGETGARLRSFTHGLEALVFVSTPVRYDAFERPSVSYALGPRQVPAEVQRWRAALGPLAEKLNGSVERAASQFHLDDHALVSAAAAAREATTHDAAVTALWDSARIQARRGLDALAERIDSRARWADLVLPAPQLDVLRTITVHLRERHRVYEDWGFAAQSTRGLGIAALFAGGSGTGKTLAAEVIANELRLDLYRVDLARLVSKYIGETEKNLARVFEAATASGAIILFDEADALFGKRSEVRDSHDRYANIEVSYLLQRIETYRGLSILTTNLKPAIDPAFLRRFRFIVQFPFPDATARREIWSRVFPAALPVAALDTSKLSRLSVSGGHIRNIALQAAFLAADQREPLQMRHLRDAAESEYAKLEKSLSRAEIGDWT